MEAVGASEVFIADAAGLPIAGTAEPEARLAAAGVVGSSVAHLAAAIPGNSSALFELHVGEGPFFQLIGFDVGAESYLVGFQRATRSATARRTPSASPAAMRSARAEPSTRPWTHRLDEGSAGRAGGERAVSATEPSRASTPPPGPIALDGLAYGIDLLDALLVFHLGDAHVHALWVRPEGGVRAEDVVTTLRDAYRVAQFAGKRLSGVASPRAEAPAPLLTLELPQRTALLRRIRTYVVACIFDAAMPLGMARLIASRLAAALEPELPFGQESSDAASKVAHRHPRSALHRSARGVPSSSRPQSGRLAGRAPRSRRGRPRTGASGASAARLRAIDAPPQTLTFGSALPRRSHPPPPPAELDRVSRLLAYLEANAPEPHVVRHRLALRAGLTLAALERPGGPRRRGHRAHRDARLRTSSASTAPSSEDRVTPFGHLVREVVPYGLLSLGDQLVTYQCHHHSLFLDQTVSDALGGEGWAVRRQAAFEAAHALLASFYAEFGIIDPDERLELAGELFAAMGHGRLVFDVTAEGGTVRAHELHYGASFRGEVRVRVPRRSPLKNRRPHRHVHRGLRLRGGEPRVPLRLGHARGRRGRLRRPPRRALRAHAHAPPRAARASARS